MIELRSRFTNIDKEELKNHLQQQFSVCVFYPIHLNYIRQGRFIVSFSYNFTIYPPRISCIVNIELKFTMITVSLWDVLMSRA